ncbi:unnamed protein product [Peronospora farinosa]|uniref:Eukaryotic translation initiation factor 3 30 kDa subunit n=1 Tax=Peronospora farinosa TaxID=134698 RepID=A0AAV0TWD0_9STRA|nr:unnamed protein product [Peronospora farinosa]
MDSWDDDEFEVPSVTPVAVNWDDEEEEEEAETGVDDKTDVVATKGPLKPKQLKKIKLKEIEEKQNMEIALTKARLAAQIDETDDQRRAREKASIEEADFEMAIDAFAGAPPKPAIGATNDTDATISSMRLLSLADHEHLGDVVSSRLAMSNSKMKRFWLLSRKQKKKQTGKQGYTKVERSVGNGAGTGGKAYAGYEDNYDDYEDYDDFM